MIESRFDATMLKNSLYFRDDCIANDAPIFFKESDRQTIRAGALIGSHGRESALNFSRGRALKQGSIHLWGNDGSDEVLQKIRAHRMYTSKEKSEILLKSNTYGQSGMNPAIIRSLKRVNAFVPAMDESSNVEEVGVGIALFNPARFGFFPP